MAATRVVLKEGIMVIQHIMKATILFLLRYRLSDQSYKKEEKEK